MTAAIIAAAPAIPAPPAYGAALSDTSGLTTVHGLFGGPGTARWTALGAPCGQRLTWYLELLPGSGCGRPLHSASLEELYYIVAGEAVMTVTGLKDLEEITVKSGDLIPCPPGSVHGIRVPAGAAQPAALYVVKAAPGTYPASASPEPVPMPARLDWTAGYRGQGCHSDVRVATVDLSRNLTGPLRRATLIEIPPETTLGPYDLPVRVSEDLFVTSGTAEISIGNVTVEGSAGIFAAAPMHARCQVGNTSGDHPLYVISTEAAA